MVSFKNLKREMPNQLVFIHQDSHGKAFKIFLDRKEKILIKKNIEINDIMANSAYFTLDLKFENNNNMLENYQKELLKLEEKTILVKEDYNSKLTHLYFKYHYVNYSQCFYYEDLENQDLVDVVNFLAKNAYFSTQSRQKFNYFDKEIEVYKKDSDISSITLDGNKKYYILKTENFEEFSFEPNLSSCVFYDVKTQTPDPQFSKELDESIYDEIYSHFKSNFLSQYDTLLVNIPQKKPQELKQFSLSFDFCGNWCGPHYGGFDDEQCKDVCLSNLQSPSQECLTCRPPLSDVDSVCMAHDFCCKRTYQTNQDICGEEVYSYDCECHRNMRRDLSNISWDFKECNFLKKIMMEVAFTFLKCRCRGQVQNVKFEKCVPLFLCPE